MKMAMAILASAILLGGVMLSLVLGTYQLHNSSVLPEYLALTDVNYGVSHGGWVAVTVNNTGIGSVTLVKLAINDVKQSSVYPPLPITLAPDTGAVLNATLNVTGGESYQIEVFTAQGDKFSKSDQAPIRMEQGGVILYLANVNFYGNGTKIDIDIGSSGTSDTTIIQVYIGTSSSAMDNETISPVPLRAGTTQRITVNYAWQFGGTYYFKVVASTGQSLLSSYQAPNV